MTAIAEDYVSFEIAKLLKEKGFDWYVYAYYENEDNPNVSLHASKAINWNKTEFISKPTIQMTTKWLRKNYRIMITIIPQEIELGVDRLNYGIYKITENFYQPLYNGKVDNLVNSYEKTFEAAIKYCLENLI